MQHMFTGLTRRATFSHRTLPLLYYGRSTRKSKTSIGEIIGQARNRHSQIVCDNQCDNPPKTLNNSSENPEKKVFAIGIITSPPEYLYRTNKKTYSQNDYIILDNAIELSNKPIAKIQSNSTGQLGAKRGILSIGKIINRGYNAPIVKFKGGLRTWS